MGKKYIQVLQECYDILSEYQWHFYCMYKEHKIAHAGLDDGIAGSSFKNK